MKYLFLTLFISLYSCSQNDNFGEVRAKLRITIYNSKERDGQSLLLLTTIFENQTDKNIYFIKSYPWSRHFLEQNVYDEFLKINIPELSSRVRNDCIHNDNYLQRIINSQPKKRMIIDSISEMNLNIIKNDYGNYPEKFKSQFLVLNKGEILEVDNTPIYNMNDKISQYKFLSKRAFELTNRKALGENLIMPSKIGRYHFWDGEIKLDLENIEILFKEI